MQATNEKVVSIDYTLKDDQGRVLDTSEGKQPLSYLHGKGNIIPGLEQALEGKSPGETLDVSIPPTAAYGERSPELAQSVPRDRFPEGTDVQVGQQFQVQTPQGVRMVTVAQVDENAVTVDGNHPLAGQTLNFNVTVTDVREPTSQELENGRIG